MKLKDIEGTPEEIRDLFKNNGMKISEYLLAPVDWWWLVLPIFGGVACVALIVLGQIIYPEFGSKCLLGSFVIGLVFLVWMAIVVQIKYSSPTSSAIAGIGGLLILLVAAGVIPIAEILPAVISLKP